MPAPKAKPEFTWVEGLAFCLAYVAIQLGSETFNQWGTYFYSPPEGSGRTIYIGVALTGWIFILGTLWDAITDPLVGAWSDLTKSRPGLARLVPIRGRRRPFIFWGAILLVFSFIGVWYPPVPHESWWNFAFGAFMLCLHWTFFTITTVPLLALGPEVARSEAARVKLGIWIAVGMIAGLAIANALSGVFIQMLDVPHEGEFATAAGYRRLAALYAFLSLGLFLFFVWAVRERYDSEAAPPRHEPVFAGFADALRNVPFVLYFIAFFCFSAGFLAVQRVLPYWAELGLEGSEETVTLLLIPYLVSCLLTAACVPALARRFHVKWLMFAALFILSSGLPFMYPIGMLDAPPNVKIALGGALFAYSGIGQGILYVMITPMLGEIIDHDEASSGHRREALYNGLSGVAWKASMGVSILLATQSMAWWGNSHESPLGVYLVGPLAGLLAMGGCVALWFYPVLELAGRSRPR